MITGFCLAMRALMRAPMLVFPSIGTLALGIASTGELESALHDISVQPGGGDSVGAPVALAASSLTVILPARRALRTAPIVALRHD